MTMLKSSSSFSPMTFRDYMKKFLILCNQKDATGSGWGWFVDIEQNNNNKNPKTCFQKIFKSKPQNQINNCPSPIKYNKSYSDIKTSSELLFFMDEDLNTNPDISIRPDIMPTIYKKITCNMIGIIFVIAIYVTLL